MLKKVSCSIVFGQAFQNWNVFRVSILDLMKGEAHKINCGGVEIRIVALASSIIVDFLFIQFFNVDEFRKFGSNFVEKGMIDIAARLMENTDDNEVCQYNFITIFWRLIDYCLEIGNDYKHTVLDNADKQKIFAAIQNAKDKWAYNMQLKSRADQILSLLA